MRRYLTLDEAAQYLALSRRSLQRCIAAGDVPAYKVRGRVLLRLDQLDAWIDRSTTTKSRVQVLVDRALGRT